MLRVVLPQPEPGRLQRPDDREQCRRVRMDRRDDAARGDAHHRADPALRGHDERGDTGVVEPDDPDRVSGDSPACNPLERSIDVREQVVAEHLDVGVRRT